MNEASWERIKEVFQSAIELTGEDRADYLDSACASDDELRARVEAMLGAHADGGAFLDPDAGPAAALLREGSPVPSMEGTRVGNYRIVRVIAAGGMGVVYEAQQDQPRRAVALKLMRVESATPDTVRRFERESAILGRLRHPHIARIHDAGVHPGEDGAVLRYFAMELIDGRPLDVFAREEELDLRGRLELFAKLCDAVGAAHEQGVVHRDLKPGNVLVEASGDPKVLDFGVARLAGAEGQLTAETGIGQLLGTLPYMSPEQAGGDSRSVDVRSDVYSLGVVLYELLSDHMPYDLRGRSVPEALRVIQEDDPETLGATDRRLAGDVETIVAKALEKEPARRYPSAAELAADVRRFLADEPIVARPATTFYQLRKFARRHRGLVSGLAAVLATLVLGLAGTGLALREARREARHAKGISELLVEVITAGDPLDHFYERQAPDQPVDEMTVVDLLAGAARALDEGATDRPEVEAELRERIGKALFGRGRFAEAEVQLRQALALHRQLGAVEETVLALEHLSQTLSWLDRFEEADTLSDEMVALASREFGRDDRRTLRARTVRSQNYHPNFADAEVLAFARETLDLALAALPEGDPVTIHAMQRLALATKRTGDWEAGRALLEEARALCAEHLAPAHLLHGVTALYLANFTPEDEADRKEELWQEALRGYVHNLGESHFTTQIAKGLVIKGMWLPRERWTVEERDAAWERAERAYLELLPDFEARLGRCHFSPGLVALEYTALLSAMGRDEDAIAVAEERVDCLPNLRFVYLIFGVTLELRDQVDPELVPRAERLARAAWEACLDVPERDEVAAGLGGTLGVLLTRLGRRSDAEEVLVQALERAELLEIPRPELVAGLQDSLSDLRRPAPLGAGPSPDPEETDD